MPLQCTRLVKDEVLSGGNGGELAGVKWLRFSGPGTCKALMGANGEMSVCAIGELFLVWCYGSIGIMLLAS